MCTEASRPHDSDHPLIHRLWQAFQNHDALTTLLSEPETLRTIMNTVEIRRWLFEEIQRQSNGCDPCATQASQNLIRMMEASKMIRGRGYIAEDIYAEAYSRTCEWLLKKLPTYDPEKASFVHWFNKKLAWTIHDGFRERAERLKREVSRDASAKDPELPTQQNNYSWQEIVKEWIDRVERNKPDLRRCRMQDPYSYINGYDLLLQILQSMLTEKFSIDQVDWDALAQSQNIAPASLKRFCQTRCFRIFKTLP
ncbi:MAG: hypothetical protein AAGD25_11495 [Cyanobacteria bacterium P01_F01_bin.150]